MMSKNFGGNTLPTQLSVNIHVTKLELFLAHDHGEIIRALLIANNNCARCNQTSELTDIISDQCRLFTASEAIEETAN